jgi:hypothetical protein
MAFVMTITFWAMNEKLPPNPGYYYVKFTDFVSEAYWNGFRWFDPARRYLPDFAQILFTHWAVTPKGDILEEVTHPLLYLTSSGSSSQGT